LTPAARHGRQALVGALPLRTAAEGGRAVDEQFTIIGLGEVLWDLFEDGKVLGGAPFNFAFHVANLGHRGIPLSRAGEDRLGDEIISAAEDLGMPTDFIQRDPRHATGTVLVKLDSSRGPAFTIVEDVAWDYMEPDERWLDLASGCNAVCFGTLAQRSRQSQRTIQQVLAAAESAVRVCDMNFRQHFYSREVVTESLAWATVLKLNEEEVVRLRELLRPPAPVAAGGRAHDSDDVFMRALISDYGLALACMTRGAEGCRLVSADDAVSRPVPPTRVVDTVGAGDAFTAGLVVKYLEGGSLTAVADAANLLGAYVAGRRGATPRLTDEVLARFRAL
jgi:fructokinase